ncbi:cholecystokinin receptor-like [Glandiceps talaboti]
MLLDPISESFNSSGVMIDGEGNVTEQIQYIPGPPPLFVWLPTVLVYLVTFVVGLIGNVLVLFSIKRCKRLQSATNFFLASLATADLIIIAIVIPFQTPSYFSWRWELGEFVCKMLSYLTVLSSSSSVFMLTAMSIDRYFVIIHPLLAKSMMTHGRARKSIIAVWLVAIVFSFPPLYYKKLFSWEFPNYGTYHTCHSYWPSKALAKAYSLYLLFGMYLIPLVIMTYCYSRIIYVLWVSAKTSRQMQARTEERNNGKRSHGNIVPSIEVNGNVEGGTGQSNTATAGYIGLDKKKKQRKKSRSSDAEKNRKQVIIMLIVVVALFMICWGPVIWLVVLLQFDFIPQRSPLRTYLGIAFNLLSYLNSCINPICYAFISRTFRECFYWSCRTCCRRVGPDDRSLMSSSTAYNTKSTITYTCKRNSSDVSTENMSKSNTTYRSNVIQMATFKPTQNDEDCNL